MRMTFYCMDGNQKEPYFWYNSAEECQKDSGYPEGHPDIKIVEISVIIETSKVV